MIMVKGKNIEGSKENGWLSVGWQAEISGNKHRPFADMNMCHFPFWLRVRPGTVIPFDRDSRDSISPGRCFVQPDMFELFLRENKCGNSWGSVYLLR